MDVIKFFLRNALAPVFGNDLDLTERPRHDLDDSKQEVHKQGSSASTSASTSATTGDSILDLSGPRLLEGANKWLLFYRLLGQINLSNKPLYLNIIYKLTLLVFGNYMILTRIMVPLFKQKVLNMTSLNPIFVLMVVMTCLITGAVFVITLYQNLFNLSPLFKILTMPRLCFINRSTQDISGIHSIRATLYFLLYHCLLIQLLEFRDLSDFVANFNPFEFMLQTYAITFNVYNTIGLANLDYYIRFSFSAWLWALKCNVQNRRPRLAHLRYQIALRKGASESSSPITTGTTNATQLKHDADDLELLREFKERYVFVELEEVQKQLNTMDDHLEVWRSCQTGALVCITLGAFFTNGIILMLSYSTLTKDLDTFHGLVWALVALNYAILVAICYMGDSFIGYALGCFVQTVEDEYFLQQDDSSPISLLDGRACRSSRPLSTFNKQISDYQQEDEEDELKAGVLKPIKVRNLELEQQHERQQFCRITDDPLKEPKETKATECLLIKKENVSFCRELLHQFDNHLATPWSRLSLKSHLNIMAAFATLIAAQIIFDREIGDDSTQSSKIN